MSGHTIRRRDSIAAPAAPPETEKGGAVVHVLKTWPPGFRLTADGTKTFEWRRDDRNYARGDLLLLLEFEACSKCGGDGYAQGCVSYASCCPAPHGEYSGREARRRVTMILSSHFGIPEGFVIMAIVPVGEQE